MVRKIALRSGLVAIGVLFLGLVITFVATARQVAGNEQGFHAAVAGHRPVVASGTAFGGLADYKVIKTPGGYLRVYVHVPFEKPGVLSAYIDENRKLANILTEVPDRDVFTVVTLARPLSVEKASELIANTGLRVAGVGFAVRDPNHGKVSTWMWPDVALDEESFSVPVEKSQTVLGLMVIYGRIPSHRAPELWLAPEVLVADVVAAEIEGHLVSLPDVSVQELQWSVPSPYWDLAW